MKVGHNIIQLGSDPDPTKNFIIRTPPVQDGTLEIRKGTLEAPGALVATFDGTGLVDPRQYINVSAERAFDTSYTNDTTQPIVVQVWGAVPAFGAITGVIDGNVIILGRGQDAGPSSVGISFMVPPGSVYEVGGEVTGGLVWYEYRIPEGV